MKGWTGALRIKFVFEKIGVIEEFEAATRKGKSQHLGYVIKATNGKT